MGTPIAPADSAPSPASMEYNEQAQAKAAPLTNADKDERVREATRNLFRNKLQADRKEYEAQQKKKAQQNGSSSRNPNSDSHQDNQQQQRGSNSKAERRRRAAEKMRNLSPDGEVEKVSPSELKRIIRQAKEVDPDGKLPQNQWIRRMGWWDFANIGDGIPANYQPYKEIYADSGYDWDYWAQAYRMLGGFIDCDCQQGESPYGDYDRRGRGRDLSGDNSEDACGRWMMWAAVSTALGYCRSFNLLI